MQVWLHSVMEVWFLELGSVILVAWLVGSADDLPRQLSLAVEVPCLVYAWSGRLLETCTAEPLVVAASSFLLFGGKEPSASQHTVSVATWGNVPSAAWVHPATSINCVTLCTRIYVRTPKEFKKCREMFPPCYSWVLNTEECQQLFLKVEIFDSLHL
jgi:hypothetical protein